MKRVHLIISGDVHGVGFRAWIKQEADALDIVGWVKNREDQTVEVVAEGEEQNLKTLIERCGKGPDVAWVEDVQIDWQDYGDEFSDFEVVS